MEPADALARSLDGAERGAARALDTRHGALQRRRVGKAGVPHEGLFEQAV